ncbi:MAG TPA: hypothetical protein VK474_00805 [Chthoniobacterales bacterium]|nr:hypothetical protein [Chthoniobacterales bacterium]
MSARVDKRHMKRCYNTRAAMGADHSLHLSLSGANSKGCTQEFVVEMPFYFIPYLVTELQKVWKNERDYRTAEISRIDAALPEPKP